MSPASIRTLFDAIVDSIPVNAIDRLSPTEKQELNLFCEITGVSFDSSKIIRFLAAVLVLNRIKFISLHEKSVNYARCSVNEISDLLKRRYPSVFASSILEAIANQSSFTTTEPLIDQIKHFPSKLNDYISSLYLQVLKQSMRRKLGQFWTPEHISELMVELLLEKKPRSILDPCAGPGTFINSLEHVYPGFPGTITALEIHPVLFEILNVNLYGSSLELKTARGDFLETDLSMLKSIKASQVPSDRVRHDNSIPVNSPSRNFDGIICNPPYSRHHVLSQAFKERTSKELEKTFGGKFNRISSLFMYFILKSLQIISSNGTLVFITPTIIFESNYSSYLKKILKERFTIPLIMVFHHSLNVFPEVDTAACIFVVENQKPRPGTVTKLVIVEKWISKDDILKNVNQNGISAVTWENGTIFTKKQEELDHRSNWTSPRTFSSSEKNTKLIELSRYFKTMRGIATGRNEYFTYTDAELENYRIKREFVVPTVTKTRQVQKYLFAGDDFSRLRKEKRKTWLLYVNERIEDIDDRDLLDYLEHGMKLKVHEGSLIKTRKFWHVIEKRNVPVFFFTYLSRGNPRFILNEAGVRPLNVFLLMYPGEEIMVSEESKKLFWVILNSNSTFNSLRDVGRCYGGDTLKIEPKEMGKALILDPHKIADSSRTKLLKLAERLRSVSTSNNKELLQEIDVIIAKELKNGEI
ncbi:MAG: class I SAM-dependent DNA methyltransferase [Candidatus Odinarchaeota archaeon]